MHYMKKLVHLKTYFLLISLVLVLKFNKLNTLDDHSLVTQALKKIHTESLVLFLNEICSRPLVRNVLLKIPSSINNVIELDETLKKTVMYKRWNVMTDTTNYKLDLMRSLNDQCQLTIDPSFITKLPILSNVSGAQLNSLIDQFVYREITPNDVLVYVKLVLITESSTGQITLQVDTHELRISNYGTLVKIGLSVNRLNDFIKQGLIKDNSTFTSSLNADYYGTLWKYAVSNPQDKVFWLQVIDELVLRYEHYAKYGFVDSAIFTPYINSIKQHKTLLVSMLAGNYDTTLHSENSATIDKNFTKLLFKQHKKLSDKIKILSNTQQVVQKNPQIVFLNDLLVRLTPNEVRALYEIYKLKFTTALSPLYGIRKDGMIELTHADESIKPYWAMLRPTNQVDIFDQWISVMRYTNDLAQQLKIQMQTTDWSSTTASNKYLEQIRQYYFEGNFERTMTRFLTSLLILFIVSGIVYFIYCIYLRNQVINKALMDHVTKVTESLTGVSYVVNTIGAQNILAFFIVAVILLILIMLLLLRLSRVKTNLQKTY